MNHADLKDFRKIAIAVGGVRAGDAVGNDVLGMAELLDEMGYEVSIVAFNADDAVRARFRFVEIAGLKSLNEFDLVIYHHCIVMPEIEPLLFAYQGRLVIRYHNITPSHFFAPYRDRCDGYDKCEAGIAQTRKLVQELGSRAYWLPASRFNAGELVAMGVTDDPAFLGVSAPFNKLEAFRASSALQFEARPPRPELLFVGRFAPNKNHKDMVRVVAAYKQLVGPDIRLTMVGSQDPTLSQYMAELEALIEALGVTEQVRILSHVPEDTLKQLFAEASAFFCMSLHEGFCVPVVEAQALGLPVITTTTAAIGETLGEEQFGAPEPQSVDDYLLFARMIESATFNPEIRRALVRQGFRNIAERFNGDAIAENFLDNLYRALNLAPVQLAQGAA